MTEESELASRNRRITILEQDVDGERTVARHILRKVTENESAILELTKAVSRLEASVATLRSDLPQIIASTVGAIIREKTQNAARLRVEETMPSKSARRHAPISPRGF